MGSSRAGLTVALLLASMGMGQAAGVPKGVARQLPPGYRVLGSAAASFEAHEFQIVALGKQGESSGFPPPSPAAARPLLVFEKQRDGTFREVGRNDRVVMRADEGGQCDPFLDGDGTIAVKGRYFTVQNGVACGQHWTDFITFRFNDAAARYVFDNQRQEAWRMNPDPKPDAEALVRDGPPRLHRGDTSRPVSFDAWRPAR